MSSGLCLGATVTDVGAFGNKPLCSNPRPTKRSPPACVSMQRRPAQWTELLSKIIQGKKSTSGAGNPSSGSGKIKRMQAAYPSGRWGEIERAVGDLWRQNLGIELETKYDASNVGEAARDRRNCYWGKSAPVTGDGVSSRD
ncbi:hypothetical protein K438DRAFT_1780453 [Mycena galopus ATCC 62051]|nr:hypothetical protein K438DRAFT_1780453 [Mycena galopus ATCC 62051]